MAERRFGRQGTLKMEEASPGIGGEKTHAFVEAINEGTFFGPLESLGVFYNVTNWSDVQSKAPSSKDGGMDHGGVCIKRL